MHCGKTFNPPGTHQRKPLFLVKSVRVNDAGKNVNIS